MSSKIIDDETLRVVNALMQDDQILHDPERMAEKGYLAIVPGMLTAGLVLAEVDNPYSAGHVDLQFSNPASAGDRVQTFTRVEEGIHRLVANVIDDGSDPVDLLGTGSLVQANAVNIDLVADESFFAGNSTHKLLDSDSAAYRTVLGGSDVSMELARFALALGRTSGVLLNWLKGSEELSDLAFGEAKDGARPMLPTYSRVSINTAKGLGLDAENPELVYDFSVREVGRRSLTVNTACRHFGDGFINPVYKGIMSFIPTDKRIIYRKMAKPLE